MKRQFPVSIGVFVASFSALGCGVSDSEIPNRGYWTGDASVSSDASDGTGGSTGASVAADGGGKVYHNDGGSGGGSVKPGGNHGGSGGSGPVVDPQGGGGGAAGQDMSAAAGSGGDGSQEVAGAGGAGGDGSGPPVGGSGGDMGPTCPTTYTMATHIVMQVSWPKSTSSGFTVVNAGTGTVHVWTKSVFDENGNSATVMSNSCGSSLPPIQTTAIAGSEKYQPIIADSVWEQPTMPTFSGTATKNGNSYSANPGIALVGLKMTTPTGTWPAATSVQGVDHDGDGHPGIAGGSMTTGGYVAIPVDISRNNRTDRIDLATRTTMTLAMTQSEMANGCPKSYTGTANVTQFDSHVIGCHIKGGNECDSTQQGFVDTNRTVYTVTSATVASTLVADGASCADIRAALP